MSDQDHNSPPHTRPTAQPGKANPRNFRPAALKGFSLSSKPPVTNNAPPKPGAAPAAAKVEGPAANADASAANIKGLGAVVIRNEFYRDGYRNMLRVAVIQAFVILGLIFAMFYVIHIHQPENRYFATTDDGRLVPMVAMNQANLSTPALMSWVAQSVTEVMTFGFNDYERRLQESSRSFTRRGWESFTKALENSRILETLEANQQVITTIPTGAPVLEREGLDPKGRYFWQVKIPISVTYQSGSRSRSDRLAVTLNIVRVPRLESQFGIGIEQWIAVPGGL